VLVFVDPGTADVGGAVPDAVTADEALVVTRPDPARGHRAVGARRRGDLRVRRVHRIVPAVVVACGGAQGRQ
jgi:hypothetical protein